MISVMKQRNCLWSIITCKWNC